MMGTLIAPLNNGQKFRLRACLSLAETSPGPVLLEFVLANSANLAQQQVIHQVWVIQKNGWIQYLPPCFTVPPQGNWDRLIIRTAKVPAGAQTYQTGYAYVDNVNICCCGPTITHISVTTATVTVKWMGFGQLQAAMQLGDPGNWSDVPVPPTYDPVTDEYSVTIPLPSPKLFFRILGPDDTVSCDSCP